MALSKRLQAVADMVTEGKIVADVGTDHGYIPIYLVKNHIAPSAYAMDINEGPIARAAENIQAHNLQDHIQAIRSDGMERLEPGMAQSVVIAGMGGELMMRIIEDSKVLDTLDEMVLSPHSEKEYVREQLMKKKWKIIDEVMVKDNDKYYTVMKWVHGEEEKKYTEEELMYGRYLIQNKSDIFIEYLNIEYQKYTNILNVLDKQQSVAERKKELEQLCILNRKARGLNG